MFTCLEIKSVLISTILVLVCLCVPVGNPVHADELTSDVDDGLEWHEHIVAGYYGSANAVLSGAYGNKLKAGEDFYVALPSRTDSLDILGGKMACRENRCGDLNPSLEDLLYAQYAEDDSNDRRFEFWMGCGDVGPGTPDLPSLGDLYGWIIDGNEGDGLFRVIEIKKSGTDGPILEAFIADVGPWNTADPYWEDYTRPHSETGLDSRGRRTNRGGIDLSWALAQEIGCTGLLDIDWRWKTIDEAYVVLRQPTEWNY